MRRRENLPKAIYDIGNLGFAVLVLGPIVNPEVFNVSIVVVGVIITVLMIVSAYLIQCKPRLLRRAQSRWVLPRGVAVRYSIGGEKR